MASAEQVALVAAMKRWWRAHGERWRVVRWLVNNVTDADDVEAEVLCVMLERQRGASRWDPARASIDAYVGVIGRSIVLDIAKRRRELPSEAAEQDHVHVSSVPWRSGSVHHATMPGARYRGIDREARATLGLGDEVSRDGRGALLRFVRDSRSVVYRPVVSSTQMGLFGGAS